MTMDRQEDLSRLIGRLESKVEMLSDSLQPTVVRAVSDVSREYMKDVNEGLEKTLDKHFAQSCKCPVPDCKRSAVTRILSAMEDVGDGDVFRGIAVVRQNLAWTLEARTKARESKKILLGAIVTVGVTALSALVLAFFGLEK